MRRGQEHDLVLVARRSERLGAPTPSVEIHVLDRGRWQGVLETPSFGIAYELPHSTADQDDCAVLTAAVADALRANDPGGLGPVDAIPVSGEPEPPFTSRLLDRVAGARGAFLGALLVAATWILASCPHGGILVAVWLGSLGLVLRAPNLDVPFTWDQDVQRLFTGHMSLVEILFGQGLQDRHPPLYFLLLHAAQRFGQSEAVTRAPAVIAGALVGPILVWGAWVCRRQVEAAAALAALAATLAVPLIQRSREVSELPLFAIFALAMATFLVRFAEEPTPRARAALIASHALALWTYYLAPLLIAGNLVALWYARRLDRVTLRAVGLGVLLGAPSLGLAAAALLREGTFRDAARTHPALAWGERGVLETTRLLAAELTTTFGVPLVVVLLVVAGVSIRRRDAAVLVPLASFTATFAGIALMAPVVRVQPYYLTAVLPLGALAVGLGASRVRNPLKRFPDRVDPFPIGTFALAAVVALTVVPQLHEARSSYLPNPDAFMPSFARIVADRPERRVAVVAHYDATLLAYYLARVAHTPMDWARMHHDNGQIRLDGLEESIVPLAESHRLGDDPDGAALDRLRRALEGGPILVIAREAFKMERVERALDACDVLAQTASGSLLRCFPQLTARYERMDLCYQGTGAAPFAEQP